MHIYPHQEDPLELMDTVYDEGFHAAFPDIDNDAVRDACTDIKRLLVRMGIEVTFGNEAKTLE